MCGWLVFNTGLSSKKFSDIHEMYVAAAKKLGIQLYPVGNAEVTVTLTQQGAQVICAHPKPDFVIFLDKDIALAAQLEQAGLRLFNSASAIANCDDKALTTRIAAAARLAIPQTIVAPLQFAHNQNDDFLQQVVSVLSFPIVVKESFGSFGEQVHLANDMAQLKEIRAQIGARPHIYQQFVAASRGRDLRVYVVAGKVVVSVKRVNDSDFRANVTNGGSMQQYTAPQNFQQLAIAATNAVGAHFAGVDLLFDENEQPVLCEVNSNAHIKNVYDTTGINVADNILQSLAKEIFSI